MREKILKTLRLEKEVAEIKKILSPWKGMTWSEAEKAGWSDEHKKLQLRLWELGYKISILKGGKNE